MAGAFGIIVSGGPAPGINCIISSVVIDGRNHGFTVKGLNNGFKDLAVGAPGAVVELSTDMVTRIYNTGGSILGTSRFNPFLNPEHEKNFFSGLDRAGIDKLVVVGGEGSAVLSYKITQLRPDIQVVHVPKTIDNDLVLPNQAPSFGFETARFVGTGIVDTLMTDAKTTQRWFVVTSMGRKAGFLALGLGIASGATLTLIPEEFEDRLASPTEVAAIIFESMKRRCMVGKNYGVAIIAEGVLDRIDPEQSPLLRGCSRDGIGRLVYSEVEFGEVILPELRAMCRSADIDLKIITKNIGYELRCHEPVSFDIEYTKFLGFGAVQHLVKGRTGIMVTREFDRLGFMPLAEMVRPDGTIQSRKVDLDSDLYRVSRSFMIR